MTSTNHDPQLQTDLVALLVDEVALDPDAAIEPDTELLLSGLVDSLGVIQIVGWMEDRLGCEIDPIDVVLENFQSVAAMTRFVGSLPSA